MKYDIFQTINDLEKTEGSLKLIPETSEEEIFLKGMNSELKKRIGDDYVLRFFSKVLLPDGHMRYLAYRAGRRNSEAK